MARGENLLLVSKNLKNKIKNKYIHKNIND